MTLPRPGTQKARILKVLADGTGRTTSGATSTPAATASGNSGATTATGSSRAA